MTEMIDLTMILRQWQSADSSDAPTEAIELLKVIDARLTQLEKENAECRNRLVVIRQG